MPNQKLENVLNLALDTPSQERVRSQELETGFNPEQKTWELIVKYSGSLDDIRLLGIHVDEMRNEYAILTVPEPLIDQVSSYPQIEYIEKPKRLFFSDYRAKSASCINVIQEPPFALSGRGILLAILDSGIDYFHPDFRREDGSTRITALWDQVIGRVFSEEEINEALKTENREQARRMVPSVDISGHGTAVAGIAAGNGSGIAYESDLLVVRMGIPDPNGFPRTTELMRAVNFAVTEAVNRQMPLVVNISFGNTYGSHDGTSLLETFLNDIGNYGRTTIVTGSGNEGASGGHAMLDLSESRSRVYAELSVAPFQSSFSVQIWKEYTDQFQVQIQTPSGERFGPLSERLGPVRYRYKNTWILIYYGKPGPYSRAQEIYLDLIPDEGKYVESGIWRFEFFPREITVGRVDLWLPSASLLNLSTRFLESSPETTLTIPSAAEKVITVGAYDSRYGTYADFSGRGFTRLPRQVKPDLVAPGVEIMAPAVGGGYDSFTGTSFAAPVVSGSAALLMQWGIVNGHDPFLYGEKVKAYLRRGAKPLGKAGGEPNPQEGFGALCVKDSFPE
ncbi:MAG: S8 family peptidase [Brotaphodocola sp.]